MNNFQLLFTNPDKFCLENFDYLRGIYAVYRKAIDPADTETVEEADENSEMIAALMLQHILAEAKGLPPETEIDVSKYLEQYNIILVNAILYRLFDLGIVQRSEDGEWTTDVELPSDES